MLDVSISVVSHNHGELLRNTVESLTNAMVLTNLNYEIIITFNIPERSENVVKPTDNLVLLHNELPKGFGANHNAALSLNCSMMVELFLQHQQQN